MNAKTARSPGPSFHGYAGHPTFVDTVTQMLEMRSLIVSENLYRRNNQSSDISHIPSLIPIFCFSASLDK